MPFHARTENRAAAKIAALTAAALLRVVVMSNVDTAGINVALPAIQHSFHTSEATLQFIVAGYVPTFATLLVIGARLGDLYGYR